MAIRSNPFSLQDLLTSVRHTLSVFKMLKQGDGVLVGVSGGPDSVALLHALIEISRTWPLRVGVAHLNHGLRGTESDADAAFVENLAKKLNLVFFSEHANFFHAQSHPRKSLEETCREARYAFFNRVADREGFDKIAVGHHADDTAEMILINLIRGSGASGLKGIPPVRGKIIRPLIRVSRESIVSYLQDNQFCYRIDSSNSDQRFLRNKIRHQLLPILKSQYNPNICETLNRLGNLMSAEEEWISGHVDLILEQCVQSRDDHGIALSIDRLREFHTAAQRRVIRRAISLVKGDLRRISLAHVIAVMDHFTHAAKNLRLDLPDRIRIRLQEGRLLISREKKSLRSIKHSEKNDHSVCFERTIQAEEIFEGPVLIEARRLGLRFKKSDIKDIRNVNELSSDTAFFDWDRLTFPLKVRNYRTGDVFVPLGMRGSQSLKKFFVNNKISRKERLRVPLLLSEDKIIWVIGARISDPVKIRPETNTVLCAEVFSLKK
jgi:tRNA(Ile)-lysidine synthase